MSPSDRIACKEFDEFGPGKRDSQTSAYTPETDFPRLGALKGFHQNCSVSQSDNNKQGRTLYVIEGVLEEGLQDRPRGILTLLTDTATNFYHNQSTEPNLGLEMHLTLVSRAKPVTKQKKHECLSQAQSYLRRELTQILEHSRLTAPGASFFKQFCFSIHIVFHVMWLVMRCRGNANNTVNHNLLLIFESLSVLFTLLHSCKNVMRLGCVG